MRLHTALRAVPALPFLLAGLAAAPAHAARSASEFVLCDSGHRVLVLADDAALARRFAGELSRQMVPVCRSFGAPLTPASAQQLLRDRMNAAQQALVDTGRVTLYVEEGRPAVDSAPARSS